MTSPNRTSLGARATGARVLCVGAFGLILLQACGDGTSPSQDATPASVAASATDTLRGVAGAALSTPLGVVVKNKSGTPIAGVGVTFQVASGGGTLSRAAATTDTLGRATTTWVLGPRTGVQQATAAVGSLPPVSFVAVAGPASPASIVKASGDAQTATVGSVLAASPSVSVKDEFGNPVADATVTFTVTAGAGTVAASSARTNASGTASVAWTLGPRSGAQTLSATVGTLAPVTFAATATPDVPTSIRFGQTDPVVIGVGYSQQLSASAVDRFGNATPASVSLSVATGGAFFTLAGDGVATGTARGTGTMLATAGSLTAAQSISIVDPWSRVAVNARPFGVAVSSTSIFATQLDAASVTRLQLSPFATIIAVSAVGNTPTDVAVNPSGTTALVSNQSDGTVGVINLSTNQQTRAINAGGPTFRVITSADGTRGYATQATGQLITIDLANGTSVGSSIVIPSSANGVAMGPGDTLLYVSSVSGNVAVVNVRQNLVTRTITIPGSLQDVALSADASTLYVAHEDAARVDVVSLTTGTVTSQITVPFVAFGLKLSPDGRTLFVTHPSAGRVTAVNPETGLVVRSFAVGGTPRRIAFDRATGRAIVTNEGGWLDYLFLP